MELELETITVLILAEMETEMEEMVMMRTIRRNQQSLSVVSDLKLWQFFADTRRDSTLSKIQTSPSLLLYLWSFILS